jgi:hypothetical protein
MLFRRVQKIYYASRTGGWPAAAGGAIGSGHLATRLADQSAYVRAFAFAVSDKSRRALALHLHHHSVHRHSGRIYESIYRAAARTAVRNELTRWRV